MTEISAVEILERMEMADPITVKVSHRFDAPAEKVFSAWLEPAQVRKWLSTALKSMGLSGEIMRIEIDPKTGGTFLFSDMRNSKEARHWGNYLEIDYPRRLAFTWNTVESDESDPCMVVLSIEPDGEGSIATIVNDMDAKWADQIALTENGWRAMLQAEDALLKLQSAGE